MHDPMFSDTELRGLGWEPYHFGEEVDAVVVQADHIEYRELRPDDVPGVQALIDGRRVATKTDWAISLLHIGARAEP